MIEATARYYAEQNANIHRGVYWLSERASAAYEGVRTKAANFLGAADPREIVFTRGTTEAINLVASSWGRANLKAGDEVLITAMEHHSNIVPWQLICEEKGARLVVIPMNRQGELLLDEAKKLIGPRTRIVALAHVSNSLGTINPVREIVDLALPGGRARAGLRVLRGVRPQDVRPDRYRGALRQGRAARRDGALPGRR